MAEVQLQAHGYPWCIIPDTNVELTANHETRWEDLGWAGDLLARQSQMVEAGVADREVADSPLRPSEPEATANTGDLATSAQPEWSVATRLGAGTAALALAVGLLAVSPGEAYAAGRGDTIIKNVGSRSIKACGALESDGWFSPKKCENAFTLGANQSSESVAALKVPRNRKLQNLVGDDRTAEWRDVFGGSNCTSSVGDKPKDKVIEFWGLQKFSGPDMGHWNRPSEYQVRLVDCPVIPKKAKMPKIVMTPNHPNGISWKQHEKEAEKLNKNKPKCYVFCTEPAKPKKLELKDCSTAIFPDACKDTNAWRKRVNKKNGFK